MVVRFGQWTCLDRKVKFKSHNLKQYSYINELLDINISIMSVPQNKLLNLEARLTKLKQKQSPSEPTINT